MFSVGLSNAGRCSCPLISFMLRQSQLLYISCGQSHPQQLTTHRFLTSPFFFCCCRSFLASLRYAGCFVNHWLLLKLPIWIYMSIYVSVYLKTLNLLYSSISYCFVFITVWLKWCAYSNQYCVLCLENTFIQILLEILLPEHWNTSKHLYTCSIPHWNKRFLSQKRAPVQKCKILIKAKNKKLNQIDLKNRKLCLRLEVFLVFLSCIFFIPWD